MLSNNNISPNTIDIANGNNESWGKIIMICIDMLWQVHKIVDLSSSPDREAMWYLEVIEAYKLFYQPLVEDFI